jgi:type IV secretory pathway TraG/TraD family ATPase VirD4
LPARAAATHLNRPDRERGSVLSNVVRHTAWLDDPRLCATLTRSDFSLRDLKRRSMTAYICSGHGRGIRPAQHKPALPCGAVKTKAAIGK